MGIISGLIKDGLKIGALITAYQASQKTRRETGSLIGAQLHGAGHRKHQVPRGRCQEAARQEQAPLRTP